MAENVYEALFELQGRLRGVQKDKKNDHFKNRYATLEQVTDTIRPHTQELGLLWIQTPGEVVDGCIEVTTQIMHVSSMSSVSSIMHMPLAKRDPQGAGSAMTYAMRYSLMAILGLPPTDDDAETAIDRHETRPEPQGKATEPKGPSKNEDTRKIYKYLQEDLQKLKGVQECRAWWSDADVQEQVRQLPADWAKELKQDWIFTGKRLAAHEEGKNIGDTVGDIVNQFDGRVVNETVKREQSPLEAGE